MPFHLQRFIFALLFSVSATIVSAQALIPVPAHINPSKGEYRFRPIEKIIITDTSLQNEATELQKSSKTHRKQYTYPLWKRSGKKKHQPPPRYLYSSARRLPDCHYSSTHRHLSRYSGRRFPGSPNPGPTLIRRWWSKSASPAASHRNRGRSPLRLPGPDAWPGKTFHTASGNKTFHRPDGPV